MSRGYKEICITSYTEKHSVYDYEPNLITIYCYSRYVGGTGYVGEIDFFLKGQVPKSSVSQDHSGFYLTCEIDRYQEIIETFRYEKPIYINIDWDDNDIINYGRVTTGSEPVGEQEGPGTPS